MKKVLLWPSNVPLSEKTSISFSVSAPIHNLSMAAGSQAFDAEQWNCGKRCRARPSGRKWHKKQGGELDAFFLN
jgi:hypothetical protein